MKAESVKQVTRSIIVCAAAVLTVAVAGMASPARAQYTSSPRSSVQQQDTIIKRAFQDILKREPTGSELRRYRSLMTDDGWNESDVRSDVRSRRNANANLSRSDADPDRVIRRAYQDILHREPDQQGLRNYRIKMLDNGWTEEDVRQAIRKSPEHDNVKQDSADRIVRRAYEDILEREPDSRGLAQYRNEILTNGWTERQVRDALMKSPEYRGKNAMTREKAEGIVNRAYRSVLGRDADAGGMEGYVQRVLRDKWTEADVARELRKSDEYRNKR